MGSVDSARLAPISPSDRINYPVTGSCDVMLCFEIQIKFAVPDLCPMTEKNNGDNPSNSYTLGIITTERERD